MIDHSHLTTKVYEWLKERILHHVFLPGDKLDIQQLADDLGVSRTPVKDAINRLSLEGLVTLQNRRGTYVATLTETVVHEIIEARLMIESWAVAHLTPAVTAGAKAQVAEMLEEVERTLLVTKASLFDGDQSYSVDQEWHALLVRLTGNTTLVEMHRSVLARLQVGNLYFLSDEEAFQRTRIIHVEHARAMRAFLDDDFATLASAVAEHIGNSEREYRRLLQRYERRRSDLRAYAQTGSA